MKKAISLMMAALIFAVVANDAHAGKGTRYECRTYVGSKLVLTLPVLKINGTVIVTFHGTKIAAYYKRLGLNQLWNFDFDDPNTSHYVQLSPDLTAGYYDFTGAEEGEKRKPESVFECTKRK